MRIKLNPVRSTLEGKRVVLIDDSIVRGTQLGETTEFLYHSGAREVHIRPACPPILYGCKYLNFSRSTSEMELISRRVIEKLENGHVTDEILKEYADPESARYEAMQEETVVSLTSPAYASIVWMTSSKPPAWTRVSSVPIAGTARSKAKLPNHPTIITHPACGANSPDRRGVFFWHKKRVAHLCKLCLPASVALATSFRSAAAQSPGGAFIIKRGRCSPALSRKTAPSLGFQVIITVAYITLFREA